MESLEELVMLDYSDVELEAEMIQNLTSISKNVIEKCYDVENLIDKNLMLNIIFTNNKNIQEINKEYRNIDKSTDVLSFPMFEKEEIEERQADDNIDILGDIIISLETVKLQAEEYGHSFERELSYMLVHGFYHLMGYDHMNDEDKLIMREKEEGILKSIKCNR